MLSLHQKLSQTQKLSPQQIQYQKLLQLNTLALEQRIKTELELNPILEEALTDELVEDIEVSQDQNDDLDKDSDLEDDVYDNNEDFEAEDYMNEGELDEIRINHSPDEDKTEPVAPSRETLIEGLIDQVHMLDLSEEEIVVGEMILASLSDEGYFNQDLEKFVKNLNTFDHINISVERTKEILSMIQHLEPIAIAAKDLQDCLLIQLRSSSFDPYYTYLADKLLSEYFKDFTNKRYDAIQKNMNLSVETLKSVIDLIQKLNPRPGEGNILSSEANQVTPDFIVEKVDDNFVITLNDRSVPSITISRTYLEMLEANKGKRKINKRQKEAHKFLREKFESAKWFIASIQQRRETLMKIMRAILEKQFEFFEYGAKALKPMIYKDIAEEIMMDISTISRVVNGKYVQSPVGIHELKYFFSEGLSTDTGEEISNKHIKELIKDIIDNESKKKPFSDDKIANILVEKGIHIARRTVAKYREQLKIPVARLRKELV